MSIGIGHEFGNRKQPSCYGYTLSVLAERWEGLWTSTETIISRPLITPASGIQTLDFQSVRDDSTTRQTNRGTPILLADDNDTVLIGAPQRKDVRFVPSETQVTPLSTFYLKLFTGYQFSQK